MDMVIMAIPNVEERNHVGVQMRHFLKKLSFIKFYFPCCRIQFFNFDLFLTKKWF